MEIRITLRAARINAELTQNEASELLGIDRGTLQNYESGKTIPNWATALRISELYKLPLDCIVFGSKSA